MKRLFLILADFAKFKYVTDFGSHIKWNLLHYGWNTGGNITLHLQTFVETETFVAIQSSSTFLFTYYNDSWDVIFQLSIPVTVESITYNQSRKIRNMSQIIGNTVTFSPIDQAFCIIYADIFYSIAGTNLTRKLFDRSTITTEEILQSIIYSDFYNLNLYI